jgi:hypothetical protein
MRKDILAGIYILNSKPTDNLCATGSVCNASDRFLIASSSRRSQENPEAEIGLLQRVSQTIFLL